MSYIDDVLRDLKSAGFIAHAREFEQAIRALRAIHTWATFAGGEVELDADHIARLTTRALKPYRDAKRTGGGTK